MSNPLVDRILNNPLTFVAAKNQELEEHSSKRSSYIVLSSKSETLLNVPSGPTTPKIIVQPSAVTKPKSLAETIAQYTGKKYKAKTDRTKPRQMPSVQQPEPDSSDSTEYESALEFQTGSSFRGYRSSSDVTKEEPPRSDGEDLGELLENASHSHDQQDSSYSDTRTIGNESSHGSTSVSDSSLHSSESDSELSSSDESESPRRDTEDTNKIALKSILNRTADAIDHGSSRALQVLKEQDSEYDDDESDEDDDSEDPDVNSDGCENDMDDDGHTGTSLTEEELSNLKQDLMTDARESFIAENESSTNDGIVSTSLPELPPSPPDFDDHYKVDETSSDSENGSRITTTWSKSIQNRKPVGLINFGVTCYMNSAIQSMVHIPAMHLYLMEIRANKHTQIAPQSVSHTLAELSASMWGFQKEKGPLKFVVPKKMVQRLDDINCMMSEWQQEDSHEYFMSLMSRLQEESTPKGRNLSESVLYDIFGGLLEQKVICQECKTVSITKQEFYDLSLGFSKRRVYNDSLDDSVLKYSTERAIRDYFSLETIRTDRNDPSSGYFCEKCGRKTNATKKSTVEKSPQTLLVHMKRFKFNGNSSLKVKQPIAYLKYLSLEKHSNNAEPLKYQLISVIVHEGRSILSGHYVAHCLQPNGTWATYDDEYISKIDERSALSDPSAYCLVYTKLKPKRKRGDGELSKPTKRSKMAKI